MRVKALTVRMKSLMDFQELLVAVRLAANCANLWTIAIDIVSLAMQMEGLIRIKELSAEFTEEKR